MQLRVQGSFRTLLERSMEVGFAECLQGAFATSGAGCTHLYMHASVREDRVLVANSGEGGHAYARTCGWCPAAFVCFGSAS